MNDDPRIPKPRGLPKSLAPKVEEPKPKPRSELKKEQDVELDRILDKISSQGFQSLTDAEKATLQKMSESQQHQR